MWYRLAAMRHLYHITGYIFQGRWLVCLLVFLLSSVGAYSQVTIPVVVHIVSDDPEAITDATIIAAINDLNDAFAHAGPYAIGPGADTKIRFCLAKYDPDGGITTGITRTRSVLEDFDTDIEDTRAKNLISWDNRRYANIWYVKGLKSEIYPSFSCGKWSRMKEAGYATFSNGSDFRDGIVVTGFGVLLAHEMGHYLGLKHTFSINSCINNDCSVDGDGICDTPPQSIPGGSCTSPQNSCFTDTLSGYAKDTVDLNVNFMSYSGCANMFTEGQAQKMRDNLGTIRSSLLLADKCAPPCPENMKVSFTRDNWFPVPGSVITFSATATNTSNYEWTVNGVAVGANSPALTYNFPALGKYKVSLKAYNADPSCYAIYTHYVIVSCGVMARFYPDKRTIASKAPILIDTILFTNRSVNATSFQWLMSNDTGMAETVVSASADLQYPFLNKGNYNVRLIASNGACSDTTETFRFKVEDPAMDGSVILYDANCYQETKVKLKLYVCNNGYATVPKGTPISFYDRDPRMPEAVKLDTTFLLPDPVPGKCCGIVYDLIIDLKKTGVNTIFAAFNDNGSSVPIKFPNTPIVELDFNNNFSSFSGFAFKASVTPPAATLQPGDTLQLVGTAPGAVSLQWSSTVPGLSCSTCADPIYVAKRADARIRLKAASTYGCTDSAFADVKVPPADDLAISISSVECYKTDSVLISFDICNAFKRGIIPKGLSVSFYDNDPASGGKLLSPVFTVPSDQSTLCAAFTHVVQLTGKRKIYTVVNDKGVVPFTLPNDTVLLESDYADNVFVYDYTQEEIKIVPADTSILRNTSVALNIASPVYDPSTIKWLPGTGHTLNCTTCISPLATVSQDGTVRVEMRNKYGCVITGSAQLRILPPDMTIQLLETECYSNTATLVRFRICMNNGYNAVFRNIPVSFYGQDPYSGSRQRLEPVFLTDRVSTLPCDTFSAIVNSPDGELIFAVVNDKGGTGFPDTAFSETDISNNSSSVAVTRFRVSVTPSDTSIYRNQLVGLNVTATGGVISSYQWSPLQFLSCANCLDPKVRVQYSQEVIFTARNQNQCTASDTSKITMYTDGPVNIPNAFTPNGDGKNDVFYVLGSRDIDMVKSFSVYDRYGQPVFQANNIPANDPAYGWKGEIRNGERSTSSYVYAIVVRFKDGREQLYKGTVTVIR